MSEEVHVAGVVVHARPEHADAIAQAVAQLSDARVHAAAPDGRLVVTLEASSASVIAACIDAIQQLPGVLSCALVYQHNESLEAMMEVVADDDHPPRLH
jgi:periplasmic nitrate reductase NapD